MSRVLWKGAISFGLVNIPVELYSAEKRNELSFTMLDRRNLAPVGYQRYNKETGEEVPWEEVVKGYEYDKDRYVVLSDEDFRRANVEATQTVDILGFVEAERIPQTYFDTPFYLVPGRGGEKGYALLRETLRRANKVALANVVIRTKQHLAALLPVENMLVLNTLRYADEMRELSEFDLPAENLGALKINEKEIDMALRLVENMSEEWNPEEYHDTYREDIMALIEQKIRAGKTEVITEPGTEPDDSAKAAEIIDMMTLLKRSIESKRGGDEPPRTRPGRRPQVKGTRSQARRPRR
jgi:DNA end-binding protein Ku